jgi:hypothetical protein
MVLKSVKPIFSHVPDTISSPIWLFPHWLVHARHPAPGVRHFWYGGGYGFLFAPPPKVADDLRKWADEHGYVLEISMVVDWQRQFYEWGTLAFLTGFALAGLAVWRGETAIRSGPGH